MKWAAWGITAGQWALANSAGAAVLIVLVLLVQKLFGNRISARWRHNLWLLVVVRLLMPAVALIQLPAIQWTKEAKPPIAPASAVPIVPISKPIVHPTTNFEIPVAAGADSALTPIDTSSYLPEHAVAMVAQPEIRVVEEVVVKEPNIIAKAIPAPPAPMSPSLPPSSPSSWRNFDWPRVAVISWLAGAGVVFGWLLGTMVRIASAVRRLKPIDDGALLDLLQECCGEVGIRRPPAVFAGPADFGPALVGVIRPRLVLPQWMTAQLDRDELRSILLHELIHLRRGDVAMNYVLAALTCIHWFNPLVWLAFARLRAERELACDEGAMRLSPPQQRLAYGSTILKLLELSRGGAVPPAAVGVIGNKGLMQRRIAMIARFDRNPSRPSLAALGLSIVVGATALTTATFAQDKPPQTPPAVEQARQALDAAAKTAPEAPSPVIPLPGATQAAPPPRVDQPPVELPPLPGQAPNAVNPANPFATTPSLDAVPPPPQSTRSEPSAAPSPNQRGQRSADSVAGPRTVEDASVAQADARTMERLKQPHPLESNGMPLREVLRMIADIGKLDIVTDDRAISEIGVDPDAPVTLRLHEARPLEQGLEMSLRLASRHLDYSILNGVIFVSSRIQLNQHIVTRVYDVGNADQNALSDLLTNGTDLVHRVSFVGNKLVITASELTQRHVAKLLSAVSDQMSQKRVGQKMSQGAGPRETIVRPLRFSDPQGIRQILLSAGSPNLSIAVDPRTNTLVLTAPADDLKQATSLIDKLDQPGKGAEASAQHPADASVGEKLNRLKELASLVVSVSEKYGYESQQFRQIATQVDAVGSELAQLADRLTKEGDDQSANQIRSAMDQIKSMLHPLSEKLQKQPAPELAR